MNPRRDEPDPPDPFIAAHFLERLLEDQEKGAVRPLSEYVTFFPGHEQEIVREFERLVGKAADPAGQTRSGAAPPPDGGTGPAIGRYRLLEELGRGGHGVVYLAEDARLHRKVALKRLARATALDPKMRLRLAREAEATARLDHPAICTVYEIGEDEGVPFIAMRYLEGETLAKAISARRNARGAGEACDVSATAAGASSTARRRALLDTVELIEKVARALHLAHEAGLIHRDVKPGNIMLTRTGEPVLLDFGLARDETSDGASLTEPGQILGTPAYLAPEQLQDEPSLDRRSDVYSLGVVLYEALTLERPFEAPTRECLYQAILTREPPNPRALCPSISRDLQAVVETALRKEPDRRYQTALALAEDLAAVREGRPVSVKPAGALRRMASFGRRHRRGVAVGALVLLVVLTGTVGFLVNLKRQRDEESRLRREAEEALARGYLELARRLAEGGSYGQAALAAAVARRVNDSPEARARWRRIAGEPAFRAAALWRRALRTEAVAEVVPAGRRLFLVENRHPPGGGTRARVHVLLAEDGRELRSFDAAAEEVQTAAFADGALLLATARGAIDVWDVRPGHPPGRLCRHDAHAGRVRTLRVDAQARRICSMGEDGTLKVWPCTLATARRPVAPRETFRLGRSFVPPTTLATARQGELIAAGSWAGTVKVRLRRAGRWIGGDALVFPGEQVRGLAWVEAATGLPELVTVSSGGRILVWSVRVREMDSPPSLALRPEAAFAIPGEPVLRAVRVGDRLYLAGGEERAAAPIRVVHLRDRREETRLPGHRGRVCCLAAGVDGAALYGWATGDRMVRAWDLRRGPSLWTRRRSGEAPYRALVVLADGRLAAGRAGGVDTYAPGPDGLTLAASWDVPATVNELALSRDRLVALERPGRLLVLDARPGTIAAEIALPLENVWSLTGDPAGRRSFLLSAGGRAVFEVDLESGRVATLPAPRGRVAGLALATAAGKVHLVTLQGVVLALDGKTWGEVARIELDRDRSAPDGPLVASCLAVSADGGWIAVGDSAGGVHLTHRPTGRVELLAGPPAPVEAIRLVERAEVPHLLWLSRGRRDIAFWTGGATGAPTRLETGHTGCVTAFVPLQGGGWLVTAGEDRALRLLDIDLHSRPPTDRDIRRLEDASGYYLDGFAFRPIDAARANGSICRSRWQGRPAGGKPGAPGERR